jgi:hypothetical protein
MAPAQNTMKFCGLCQAIHNKMLPLVIYSVFEITVNLWVKIRTFCIRSRVWTSFGVKHSRAWWSGECFLTSEKLIVAITKIPALQRLSHIHAQLCVLSPIWESTTTPTERSCRGQSWHRSSSGDISLSLTDYTGDHGPVSFSIQRFENSINEVFRGHDVQIAICYQTK